MTRGRERSLAALLYAVLAVLAFCTSFVGDRLFVPMHTGRFEPWRSTTHAGAQEELARGEFSDASDKLISFRADDEITARAFREGRIPLWNSTNAGGVPHLGQALYGVLYPPHWIYRWVEPERAYGFIAALHHFLAAFFTFLYVRSIGGRLAGSLLSGLAFGFSTCLLARAHYYQYVECLAWVPLGLLLVERWVRRRSVAALGGLALVMGLILLVGWPQLAAYAGFLFFLAALAPSLYVDLRATHAKILGAFCVVLAFFLAISPFFPDPLPLLAAYPATALLVVFFASPGKRAFLARLVPLGIVLGLGALIAAAQLLPAAEWAKSFGSRPPGAPESLVENGLRPRFLLELIAPGFFGRSGDPGVNDLLVNMLRVFALDPADIAKFDIGRWGNFVENACHFGWLPLLCAPLGFFARSPRKVFLLIALLWYGGFALGVKVIVYPAFFSGFIVGNDPRRALPFFVLIACVFAGFGFDRLLRLPRLARLAAVGVLLGAGSIAGMLYAGGEPLLSAIEAHATRIAKALEDSYSRTPAVAALFDLVRERLAIHFAVVGVVSAIALWLVSRGVRSRRFAIGAVLVALAIDLGLASRPFLHTQPAAGFLERPALAENLQRTVGLEGRLARIGSSRPTDAPLCPNLAGVYDLRDAFCYTVSPSRRWMRLADAMTYGWPPKDGDPTLIGSVHLIPLDPARPEQLTSRTLELFCVRAVLGSGTPPATLPPGVSLDAERFGDSYVLRTPNTLPRAFTVGQVEIAPKDATPDTLANRVLDPSFDPKTVALLESPLELPEESGTLPTAKIVRDDDRGVTIALEGGERGGLLVLHDVYAEGWTARVDGQETAVLPANFAFRAVAFPKGAREVEWIYRPRSFSIGAAISIAAAVFALCVLAFGRRATRVRCSAPEAGYSSTP